MNKLTIIIILGVSIMFTAAYCSDQALKTRPIQPTEEQRIKTLEKKVERIEKALNFLPPKPDLPENDPGFTSRGERKNPLKFEE